VGRYFVQVQTTNGEANSYGSNGFGLRSYFAANFAGAATTTTPVCTTLSGNGFSASCPQVHGITDMSVYANKASTTADFYLAQVTAKDAGKIMQITLFDPGEGASSLQVLDPNGTKSQFTWTADCALVEGGVTIAAPSGGCSGASSGANPLLDVSGSGFTKAWANVSSSSKYSDRRITLSIPLPVNYTATYGTNEWWKIRYNTGGTVTDRTTWSVQILGDPVHLTD
jgi:hypothetical protein